MPRQALPFSYAWILAVSESPIHQDQPSHSLSPSWVLLHLCPASFPWFHGLSLFSPQVCRLTLCHIATILRWSKLKAVFAKKDVFTILNALVSQRLRRPSFCLCKGVSPNPSLQPQAIRVNRLYFVQAALEGLVVCPAEIGPWISHFGVLWRRVRVWWRKAVSGKLAQPGERLPRQRHLPRRWK